MTKQVDKNLKFDLNEELTILLTKRAQELAREIYESRISKSQIRNFYDKILDLEKKVKVDGFESVYPFIKMLNSKVAYGVSRRVVSREFQDMMEQSLKQIDNNKEGEQKFKNFKLFFEAVLGFFKGSN